MYIPSEVRCKSGNRNAMIALVGLPMNVPSYCEPESGE
jgi:hypothetical protein